MENQSVCVIDRYGTKRWILDGKYHRDNDLPAIEYVDGFKSWWLNGKLHRTKGPAVIHPSGSMDWYLYGNRMNCTSQKEFEKRLLFLTFQ